MAAEGGGTDAALKRLDVDESDSPRSGPVAADGPVARTPSVTPVAEPPLVPMEGLARRLFTEPYRFDFFQAVRLLHRLFPDRSAVGRGGPAWSEPARFRALVSLSFPPSQVYDLTVPTHAHPVPELTQAFFGLTGPSGVLPRHYTEILIQLGREAKSGGGNDRTALREWLDLFNHRFLSQFYRAWEKYRVYVPFERSEFDRDEPDTFTQALLSLVGLGMPSLRDRMTVSTPDLSDGQRRKARGRVVRPGRVVAKVDDLAALYYTGFFAQRPRNAVSLEALIGDYFGVPAKVEQFQGQWLRLEPESLTRLDGGPSARLGGSAIAGERVWSVADKIRLRLGPLPYARFLDLLPDPAPVPRRKGFFSLAHLVRLYIGPELDVDVCLVLRAGEVPESRLELGDGDGESPGARLGWNTWLLSGDWPDNADDALFDLEAVSRLDPSAML